MHSDRTTAGRALKFALFGAAFVAAFVFAPPSAAQHAATPATAPSSAATATQGAHDTHAATPTAAQVPQDSHAAQQGDAHATQPGDAHGAEGESHDDNWVLHHVMDGNYIDVPWFNHNWMTRIDLPHWEIKIGGTVIDVSPTRHSVMLVIACLLCAGVMLTAARSHKKRAQEGKPPRGLANAIEAIVLYIRGEVILPNVGHHGEPFVPYLLTCFFFILFANLLGLVPYSATATSNIAVTATLATIAFLVVEIAGMRTLGSGYLKTIFFWPTDMPVAMRIPLSLILTPVEIIGKFTKPFALAIRLFANMVAGHIVILALLGMIFTFGSIWIAPLPLAMAIAIMLLEILVALIQAFVFTLLVSVFIGQVREGAH